MLCDTGDFIRKKKTPQKEVNLSNFYVLFDKERDSDREIWWIKGMGSDGAKLGEAARSFVQILLSTSLQEEWHSL